MPRLDALRRTMPPLPPPIFSRSADRRADAYHACPFPARGHCAAWRASAQAWSWTKSPEERGGRQPGLGKKARNWDGRDKSLGEPNKSTRARFDTAHPSAFPKTTKTYSSHFQKPVDGGCQYAQKHAIIVMEIIQRLNNVEERMDSQVPTETYVIAQLAGL